MNVKTNNQIVANRIDVALAEYVSVFLLTRTHKMILLLIYGFIFFSFVFLLERDSNGVYSVFSHGTPNL